MPEDDATFAARRHADQIAAFALTCLRHIHTAPAWPPPVLLAVMAVTEDLLNALTMLADGAPSPGPAQAHPVFPAVRQYVALSGHDPHIPDVLRVLALITGIDQQRPAGPAPSVKPDMTGTP